MQTRRYQIDWALLGIALLLLGALIGYSLYVERHRFEARERERLQVQARVIDENLGRQLEGVNNALAGVLVDFPLPLDKRLVPAASRRLRGLSGAMPGVLTMLLVSADGTVLASNRDQVIGRDVSQREYFKDPREHPDPATLYVSPPFRTLLGRFVLSVTRAAIGPRGEFAGVVSAALDPEYFSVLLRSVLYAPDMRTGLLHEDGKAFLAIQPDEQSLGPALVRPGSPFSHAGERGQSAPLVADTIPGASGERMLALRTVKRADLHMDKSLVVSVSRELSALYAPWRKDLYVQGGLYGVFSLIAILSLYFAHGRRRTFDRLAAVHEAEKRDSAERLALALGGADLALWDRHIPSGKVIINERWFTMQGYRLDEIEHDYRGWQERVHPDDLPVIRAALDAHLKGEIPAYESEYRMRHKDGHWVWVLARGKVVERDAAGVPVRIVGTHMDITERKQANDALRRSEARFRSLTEMSSDFYWETDAEHRFTKDNSTANQGVAPLWRTQIGQRRWELPYLSPDEAGWRAHRAVIEAHQPFHNFELSRLGPDGAEHYLSLSGDPVFDASGAFTGYRGVGTDVTARKQAENALQESESRYRVLFEANPNPMWLFEEESLRFLAVNDEAVAHYGWSREEFLSMTIAQIRPADDAHRIRAHLARTDTSAGRAADIWTHCRKDGSRFEVAITSHRLMFGGRGARFVMAQDISERLRAEAQLRLAASVFDHALEAITITDADANILAVNRSFTEITGYAADEVIGQNPRMLKSGRQGEDFYRAMWKALLSEGRWAGGIWNRRKDGRIYPEQISISAVRDGSGKTVNYVAVFSDLTQRVAAEEAIRTSERKYRTMFGGAPEGVLFVGPDRRILEVNRRLTELLGYGAEEIRGRVAMDFADEQNQEIFAAQLRLVAVKPQREYEIALRHKNGHNVPTHFSVSNLYAEDGTFMGALAFVTDLTERMRHEEELRRLNEELEKRVEQRTHALQVANRELESFCYSVSHDLRSPLRAINGFTRLIEDDHAGSIDGEGKALLQRVGAAAERMGHLIEDLLTLSRISRQEMRLGPVDLSALVREVAEELQIAEPGRQANWNIAAGVQVAGDAGLLTIALQNLIGNAWKYSSKREVASIDFGVSEKEGRPVYFVRDNGAGFDMAYADRLFGAFHRLHLPEEFPGTGIGLATVARIMHRHGGEIWAEGRVNEGATFHFTLWTVGRDFEKQAFSASAVS